MEQKKSKAPVHQRKQHKKLNTGKSATSHRSREKAPAQQPRSKQVLRRSPAAKQAAPQTVECKMVRVSAGYGFAQPIDREQEDIFIPGRGLAGTLPNEIVQVELAEHPRRPGSREGDVRSIVQPIETVTGVLLRAEDGGLCLQPDFCADMRLWVEDGPGEDWIGQKVATRLTTRGTDYNEHVFTAETAFGSAESAYACTRAILYQSDISESFPRQVQAAAKQLRQEADLTAEAQGRLDLRDKPIFTIDSASTKDMDDAIDIVREGDGYALGVHIADVSHYVRAYSALDKEALARGTSVYYADRVAPMLPKELSDDLCSLNENTDKLAFSCLMRLNSAADVTEFRFVKTIIRSRVKGVYHEINSIFENGGDDALQQKYAAVSGQLPVLKELYEKLDAKRQVRGSMDIESGEAKLIIDENGRCVGVEKRTRGVTECIIEECMILANGCAARLAREKELPFLYRVHTSPEQQRVDNLKKILGVLGVEYHFAQECPTQPELSVLLDKTRDTPLESAVHAAVLRSMPKADYRPEPLGHFGLALQDYAHFTSPIRRYPDLAIHRILSYYCEGNAPAQCEKKHAKFAQNASVQSSERELVAMEAERSCDACYKAEYMAQFIGQVFEGTITTVTSFGIYVELDNTVEGMIRAEELCAGTPMPEEGVSLVDTVSGKSWRVGERMRVLVQAVSVPLGRIDFAAYPAK